MVGFREGVGAADAEIVVRLANEQFDNLPAMALDLVEQNVKAILAASPPAVRAVSEATNSIPIIALDVESDPVANGWAVSLAHPGGNVTGIFLDLPGFNAKSLQLLREGRTRAHHVAVFWHPVSGNLQLEAVRNAAVALGIKMEMLEVSPLGL